MVGLGWRQRFSRWLSWHTDSFRLFLMTLAGYVPSHTARLVIYKVLGRVSIGPYSTIHWRCRFFEPSGISIGANTIIGNDAFLDGRRGLTIGDCVITGGEIAIYTLQHALDDPYFRPVGGPVIVENYVYLGTRCIILPGVRIGYGAVVAAGAVVTHDVEPYAVVGGVPAVFIRERSHDLRYRPRYRKPFQ